MGLIFCVIVRVGSGELEHGWRLAALDGVIDAVPSDGDLEARGNVDEDCDENDTEDQQCDDVCGST